VSQNAKRWNLVHACINRNDVNPLLTLLSNPKINLNCLNVSTESGDTILHSAVKSNDVKMMELVFQTISPSTRARMLKMRNYHQQLPSDLLTIRWAPSTIHSLFPLKFKQLVKAVLMLGAKRQDGTPYYPETHFYKLPKDVLLQILHYAAPYQDKLEEHKGEIRNKIISQGSCVANEAKTAY
jgi:hypothetical protein